MASQLFPKGGEAMLGGSINYSSDTLKVLFYAGSFVSTHQFVSDLTGASIVARSSALSGVTVANGVLDLNDVTITSVSGSAFTLVYLYKDSGVDASSPLLASFVVASFTPSGLDVSVVWNASGLFKLVP